MVESPFVAPTTPTPTRTRSRSKEPDCTKAKADAYRDVFVLLRKYARQAKERGWTGPELVYMLSITRLKEDLFGRDET